MSALFSQLHQLGLETFLPMLMGLEIIFMGLLLGWDSWTTFRWIPGVKSHGQWALGWLWFVVISSCVCVGAWFFGLYPFFFKQYSNGFKDVQKVTSTNSMIRTSPDFPYPWLLVFICIRWYSQWLCGVLYLKEDSVQVFYQGKTHKDLLWKFQN